MLLFEFWRKNGIRMLYLVSERKRKQICIYFERIIRKPNDAILCVVHDRCVAICTIGRHYKKYTIEIRSIGLRRDAFDSPFQTRRQGNALLKHNTTWKSAQSGRNEKYFDRLFFRTTDTLSKFSSPRTTVCETDVSITYAIFSHLYELIGFN